MSILEKQQVVWRSRYNKSPLLGNKLINYYEDVFFAFLFWFFIAFVVSAIVLWQINLKQFPIPPAPGFQGEWTVFHHLLALAQVFLNKIPYWHPFQTDAIAYLNMTGWLANNGILHILTWRINAALFLGFVVGVWQAVNKTEKPVPFEQTANKRGMEIILPDRAPQEFSKETFEEVKKSGKFCELAQDTFLTFSRFRTHHIGFGASGTGKSQFLNSLIRRAIELGLKLVILDLSTSSHKPITIPTILPMPFLTPQTAEAMYGISKKISIPFQFKDGLPTPIFHLVRVMRLCGVMQQDFSSWATHNT